MRTHNTTTTTNNNYNSSSGSSSNIINTTTNTMLSTPSSNTKYNTSTLDNTSTPTNTNTNTTTNSAPNMHQNTIFPIETMSIPVIHCEHLPKYYTTGIENININNTCIQYYNYTSIPIIPNDKNIYQSNSLFNNLLNSNDILNFLYRIIGTIKCVENEKILAQLIRIYLKDGKIITLKVLQQLNPILTQDDQYSIDIICYQFFIKRIIKWLIPLRNENIEYMLPMASIQARALELIEVGILSFREVFEKNGRYGVFYYEEEQCGSSSNSGGNSSSGSSNTATTTQSKPQKQQQQAGEGYYTPNNNSSSMNIPLTSPLQAPTAATTTSTQYIPPLQQLRNKMININKLYQQYILQLQPHNFLSTINYYKQHTTGNTVPTYSRLYEELLQCYGHNSETNEDIQLLCQNISINDVKMKNILEKLKS